MEGTVLCNLKKCRKPLHSGRAWVTACSHMFCNEDGEKFLVTEKKCPVCGHSLKEKLDIVCIDLNPSESYKSMVLCGHRPEIVLEVCSRALTFWQFQNQQESLYKEYVVKKSAEKLTKLEHAYTKMASDFKIEMKSMCQEIRQLKSELSNSRKQYDEINTVLKEKNRELQRAKSSYSEVKRMNMQKSHSDFSIFESRSQSGSGKDRINLSSKRKYEPPQTLDDFVIPFGKNVEQFSAGNDSGPTARSCFHGSLQSSPFQLRHLLQHQTPQRDEGVPRKLF